MSWLCNPEQPSRSFSGSSFCFCDLREYITLYIYIYIYQVSLSRHFVLRSSFELAKRDEHGFVLTSVDFPNLGLTRPVRSTCPYDTAKTGNVMTVICIVGVNLPGFGRSSSKSFTASRSTTASIAKNQWLDPRLKLVKLASMKVKQRAMSLHIFHEAMGWNGQDLLTVYPSKATFQKPAQQIASQSCRLARPSLSACAQNWKAPSSRRALPKTLAEWMTLHGYIKGTSRET